MIRKLTIFFFLGLFVTKNIYSAGYGGLGIYPATSDPQNPFTESWFIYNLVPGEEKSDAFIVKNSSDKTVSAKIYPVDGTTTADGSFTLEGEKVDRVGIGGWVKVSSDEVTVGPGEEKRIAFTISIPRNASVGDHTGGIILENKDIQKGKGVNVVSRVGVRIYETVPGQLVRKMKIGDFNYKLLNDQLVFFFSLENQGNVQLNPNGKIYIENNFGGSTDFEITLGTVLPGKPTKVPVTWARNPLFGMGKAKAAVVFGEGDNYKLERQISFSYITNKGKLVMLGIGLILLALITTPFLKKKKR